MNSFQVYLRFRWPLFLLLPLLRFSPAPPQLGADTALQVGHLPEGHTAAQRQQLGQAHTAHYSHNTQEHRSYYQGTANRCPGDREEEAEASDRHHQEYIWVLSLCQDL